MSVKRLEAITRLVAMMLVVVYTGVGIFLLKDKLAIYTSTSVSEVEEEVNGTTTDEENDQDMTGDVVDDDQTDKDDQADKQDEGSQDQNSEEGTANQEGTVVTEEPAAGENESDQQDKVPADKKPAIQFTDAPEGYFEDALFIGDSRTVGLKEYGGIHEATYFATEGMSVYNVQKENVSVKNVGNVTLSSLLANKKFGKIYLMLGINELGYDHNKTTQKYGELVEQIKKAQPSAIIFVEANMHVSQSRSDSDSIFNNKNIDKYNKAIKQFTDNETVFYLNVNPLFDDENGNLDKKYTSDNTHVLGKYYRTWTDWLATKAIVK